MLFSNSHGLLIGKKSALSSSLRPFSSINYSFVFERADELASLKCKASQEGFEELLPSKEKTVEVHKPSTSYALSPTIFDSSSAKIAKLKAEKESGSVQVQPVLVLGVKYYSFKPEKDNSLTKKSANVIHVITFTTTSCLVNEREKEVSLDIKEYSLSIADNENLAISIFNKFKSLPCLAVFQVEYYSYSTPSKTKDGSGKKEKDVKSVFKTRLQQVYKLEGGK